MDYNRPLNTGKDNPKVDVALIMIPGKNSVLTGNYSKSPMLVNPGGPGGSGTAIIRLLGSKFQEIVGLDYDIIGFDPRGIADTTPLLDCHSFPSDEKSTDPSEDDILRGFIHRVLWNVAGSSIGFVNASANSLEKLDARARLAAQLCKKKEELKGEDSILRHVSTPAVARDMLSIVDAWDTWRDDMIEERAGIYNKEGYENKVVESDHNLDTKGKLVYWGFSYGTLLGATFAAMFPDRVGRVILDGVVDADSYVSPVWAKSLLDTDAVEASFFKFCHKAGSRCAFYHAGDSEADIKERFDGIHKDLEVNPIKGINPRVMTPMILDSGFLKAMMFSSLYNPTATFPSMAEILHLFYERNENILLSIPTNDNFFKCPMKTPAQHNNQDSQLAIMCSDKRYPVTKPPRPPLPNHPCCGTSIHVY